MIISNNADDDMGTAQKMKHIMDTALWVPVRNFALSEFRCKCGCNSVIVNEDHIIHLQAFRNRLVRKLQKNVRINITSGYRCKAHNMAVGGAKLSRHMNGDATDIYSPDAPISTLYAIAEETGIFSTVIHYTQSKFIHVDSRPGRACLAWEIDK